jgi:MFS family permease
MPRTRTHSCTHSLTRTHSLTNSLTRQHSLARALTHADFTSTLNSRTSALHSPRVLACEQVQRLIEISSLIFIPMVFVMGPISDRYGLRCVTIVGAALVAMGGVCRWQGGRSYTWLLVGQTLNGMAGPLISNAPPQLAAVWFPVEHRATATAIAWAAQSIGVAIGCVRLQSVILTLAPPASANSFDNSHGCKN